MYLYEESVTTEACWAGPTLPATQQSWSESGKIHQGQSWKKNTQRIMCLNSKNLSECRIVLISISNPMCKKWVLEEKYSKHLIFTQKSCYISVPVSVTLKCKKWLYITRVPCLCVSMTCPSMWCSPLPVSPSSCRQVALVLPLPNKVLIHQEM